MEAARRLTRAISDADKLWILLWNLHGARAATPQLPVRPTTATQRRAAVEPRNLILRGGDRFETSLYDSLQMAFKATLWSSTAPLSAA